MANVTVVCSDPHHPIYPWLNAWAKEKNTHIINLVQQLSEDTRGGDILFLISCSEIIPETLLQRFKHRLVVHASDLPDGRGWSPLVWQVLDGRQDITVSLLEAVEPVDTGPIWKKHVIRIEPHELADEINHKLFDAELALMDFALDHAETIQPQPQDLSTSGHYFRKRTPSDSQLDPDKTLREQFDLLRICDPQRYPATLTLHGHQYRIVIEKLDAPAAAEN